MPQLAVVGAHLSDQPLNHQLTDRGGRLVTTTRTASTYRLFALPTDPPKPGLLRTCDRPGEDPGAGSIEVEIWELDDAGLGSLLGLVPNPLGLGAVELVDATWVTGFLCEELATRGAPDITSWGGWRAYLRSGSPAQP